jgi:hypothetical protein
MGGGRRLTRSGCWIAAVTVLSVFGACAEPITSSNFPPGLAAPLLDHDSVALPYADSNHTGHKSSIAVDHSKFQKKDMPAPSLDTFDLGGKSTLRLDVTETNTRAASDVPDYTNVIVPLAPGKKRETPRYLGFKLSTPTH